MASENWYDFEHLRRSSWGRFWDDFVQAQWSTAVDRLISEERFPYPLHCSNNNDADGQGFWGQLVLLTLSRNHADIDSALLGSELAQEMKSEFDLRRVLHILYTSSYVVW